MTDRTLLAQALAALEDGTFDRAHWITALRSALAAPQPEPVALESVHLTRDTQGMCVVRVNGRVAIRDNGDIIDHMATLEWFATPPAAPAEPCYCDRMGIGVPGVSCGDCPRDYKPAPIDGFGGNLDAAFDAPADMVMVPRDILVRLVEEARVFEPSVLDPEALAQAHRILAASPPAAPAPAVPLTDTRKLCTCDGAGRGPGRACVVQAGGRLGDLWKCAKSAAPAVREPPGMVLVPFDELLRLRKHADFNVVELAHQQRESPGPFVGLAGTTNVMFAEQAHGIMGGGK